MKRHSIAVAALVLSAASAASAASAQSITDQYKDATARIAKAAALGQPLENVVNGVDPN